MSYYDRKELEGAVREILGDCARLRTTMLYRDLARESGIESPQTIHKTVMVLENITYKDYISGQPLLAAVAISKIGIPRPGFFQLVRQLGIYNGPDDGEIAQQWHSKALTKVYEYWANDD